LFVSLTLNTCIAHADRVLATYNNDAIIVGDDDVTGANVRTRADDGRLDVGGCLFDRTLCTYALRPHWKLHFRELSNVAYTGIDHEASNAVSDETRGEKFAKITVLTRARGCHDKQITWFRLFNCDVNRPVVTRGNFAGEGVTRDSNRAIYGTKP
jgi:hypothetical protein